MSNEPVHALTGMRFIAAFSVFLYHVRTMLEPHVERFPLGPVAVSFFFVLSGYILTRVYHDRLSTGPIWGKETRRFLVTRIARLWPLHILCLLFFLNFGHWIEVSGQWYESSSIASLVANLFMLHSWFPIDHWFLGFNSVSWSIATELFFYLCFPLLFAARRRIGLVCLMLLAMTLVIQRSIQQWHDSPLSPEWFSMESVFIANPVNALWQFALGMLVGTPGKRAAVWKNPVFGPAGNVILATVTETIALLAIPAIVYLIAYDPTALASLFRFAKVDLTGWLQISLMVPAFAAVIHVFGHSKGLWARLFGCRFAVWLGETSFGFYMVHQIVLSTLEPYPIDNASWITLSLLITLLVSGIVYRVIEVPCKLAILAAWDRRWSALPGFFYSGLCGQGWPYLLFQAVALSTIFLVLNIKMPPERLPGAEIVLRQNQLQHGTIVFRQQALLHAHRAFLLQGSLHLEFVWTKTRGHRVNRFVNLHSSDNTFLRQHDVGQKPFLRALPRQQFLDVVVLPPGSWEDASYIRIGFWDRETKSAVQVTKGLPGEPANAFRVDLQAWKLQSGETAPDQP